MGVTNGRDLLSSKYPTAIIIDAFKTAHFFPLKYPIGDYFFAIVNRELYAFDVKGDSFKWRQGLAKTFEFQIFFTDHYKPVSSHMKELELVIEKNNLPKISISLYKVLSILKLKEKHDFETHKITKLLEDLVKEKDKDKRRYAQYKDVITYLQDLDIDEIVTPVKRVTEYLDESFMATDPKFMGSVKTAVQMALSENREVNHVPITSKKGWLKYAAIIMLIGIIGLVLYIAYDSGAFDGITSMVSPIGDVKFDISPPPAISAGSAAQKYPSPVEAKCAIERGDAKLNDFPAEMRGLVSSAKCVGATPNP